MDLLLVHLSFKNCFIFSCIIIIIIINISFHSSKCSMQVSPKWVLASVPGSVWTTTLVALYFFPSG